MKKLYLCRHAKADMKEEGQRDFLRELNKRGHRDAEYMAGIVKKNHGVKPEIVYSSPALRAFGTAEYMAKAFGFKPEEVDQRRELYEADVLTILGILQYTADEVESVMVVGHNPGLTLLVSHMNPETEIDNLPTCGLVGLELEIDDWFDVKRAKAKELFYEYPRIYFPREGD